MARDPRLDAALAASRAERDTALSSIRAMTAGVRREHQAFRQGKRARDEDRARRARAGELGPEMQQLQRRIDSGQTSWDAVLSGADAHPSAQAARAHLHQNLAALADVVAEDPEAVELAAETQAAQDRVAGDADGPGPTRT